MKTAHGWAQATAHWLKIPFVDLGSDRSPEQVLRVCDHLPGLEEPAW